MPFKAAPETNRSSFSRQPLRYAIPPRKGQTGAIASPPPEALTGGGPFNASLSSISFSNRSVGIKGTALPVLVRLAAIPFNQPVYIVSVTLASSISNTSATNPAILVVHKDIGANLSIDAGYDFFAEHVVEQGLSHSIRTGTSYNENIAPYFGTSDKMALYGLALDASCAMTAIVSIRYLSQS